MPKLTSPTGKPIRLRPVRPNAGVEAVYRQQLQSMIVDMASSYQYWLTAAWRQTGEIAQDRSHTVNIRDVMRKLGRRWRRKFDRIAEDVARRFANQSAKSLDAAMMDALKRAGFTVRFVMTSGVREAMLTAQERNVSLIRSIPKQFHQQVEHHVWQAVSKGGDLATLTKVLEERFGVTHKRAALIALDQNSKAHAAYESARRQELGITEAIWRHTGSSAEPRQSHKEAHGKRFDIAKGCLIDGEYIQPGELIHCGCTSEAIIPGLEVMGNYE